MVKHVLSEIPSKEYMISDERKAELDAMYSPQAEVARLRAALDEALEVVKPINVLAQAVFHVDEDGREMNARRADDQGLYGFDRVELTYGHLRAARRFYEKHKGGGDEQR
jgi:hypothetical protein